MGTGPPMSDDHTRKVAELLKGERFGFLTTTTPDGRLTSRPMTLQEVEFDGDLWFFAERDSTPVQHITASPGVNVGVGSGGSWVSLTGRAAVTVPGKAAVSTAPVDPAATPAPPTAAPVAPAEA